MKRFYAVVLVCLSLLLCVLAACVNREMAEQQGPVQVSESAQFYTVSFYENGMVSQQFAVRQGDKIQAPEGVGWCDEAGDLVDFDTLVATEDMNFYARAPLALRTGHIRYMTGENYLFHPNDPVTRAQAAQILCTFLDIQSETGDAGVSFSDVSPTDSAGASVRLAASLGIMTGYADGTFRPDEPITRGEMVTALCRLMNVEELKALAFEDVTAEHWTMGSVAAAMAKGWLSGFGDGNFFYPDAPLSRAQAVVLINRALGKTPNKAAIDMVCETSPYRDVSKKNWAYYDIVDVSYSSELMAYIMGEVEDAQQGIILLGDDLCHVNAEKKLDYFQKGFHTITDGLPTDGLYYAPENGYFLQRNAPGLIELDGSMFYVPVQDGPFAVNTNYGYLYFGENGRYTSGDTVVDGYVDAIMANIIRGDTNSLLNETKLREAYDSILFGDYDYLTRQMGWTRGSTSWALSCASVMYQTKRGSCYYWAAAFLYLARRLGFQAYPVCGGVNENNAVHAWVMIDHGAEIDTLDVNSEYHNNRGNMQVDPDEYIYDIELDWAYRTGAHGRVPIRPGRNLFKQTRGHTIVTYIFPGDTWIAPPMDDTDALGGDDDDGDEDDPMATPDGTEPTPPQETPTGGGTDPTPPPPTPTPPAGGTDPTPPSGGTDPTPPSGGGDDGGGDDGGGDTGGGDTGGGDGDDGGGDTGGGDTGGGDGGGDTGGGDTGGGTE